MQFDWVTAEKRKRMRANKLQEWHRWFAWKPVKLYDYSGTSLYLDPSMHYASRYVFLETVYRKYMAQGKSPIIRYMTKQEYFKKKLQNPNL